MKVANYKYRLKVLFKINIFVLFLLLCSCVCRQKTVRIHEKTETHTSYRDTTITAKLPPIKEQQISTKVDLVNKSFSDTLTIETYNQITKSFITNERLYLSVVNKDTSIPIMVKNGIREIRTETRITKEKEPNMLIRFFLLLLIYALFCVFFKIMAERIFK